MKVTDAQKRLARALKTLDPDQGLVGRRNARVRVARELRNLKAAVDAEFPAIRKPVTKRRKPAFKNKMTLRAYNRRLDALKAEGWVQLSATSLLADLIACGAPTKRVRAVSVRDIGDVSWQRSAKILVPDWAVRIGPDRQRIALARKSPQARAAILTEIDLRNGAA